MKVLMFFDSTNKFDAENKLLWYNVLPIGEFYDSRYGKVEITKEFVEEIVRNFNNNIPHYKPPVNIEHEDLLGAVGKVVELSVRENGLFARIELTDEGTKLLSEKKFEYMSAEFVEEYTSKETGENVGVVLVGVALTNKPAHLYVEPIKFSDINGGGINMGKKQIEASDNANGKMKETAEEKNFSEQIKTLSEQVKSLSEELKKVKEEKEELAKKLHEEKVEKWLNSWREKGIPNGALESAKKAVILNEDLMTVFDETFKNLANPDLFKQLSETKENKEIEVGKSLSDIEKADIVAKTLFGKEE